MLWCFCIIVNYLDQFDFVIFVHSYVLMHFPCVYDVLYYVLFFMLRSLCTVTFFAPI